MAEPATPEHASVTRYEPSDLSARHISLFGVGLTLTLVVVLALTYGLIALFRAGEARRAVPPHVLADRPPAPPAPRLMVEPGAELRALRELEAQRLDHYGWIDREKGVVHMPIERAMEILAEKGLPARSLVGRPKGGGAIGKQPSSGKEGRP